MRNPKFCIQNEYSEGTCEARTMQMVTDCELTHSFSLSISIHISAAWGVNAVLTL